MTGAVSNNDCVLPDDAKVFGRAVSSAADNKQAETNDVGQRREMLRVASAVQK